MRAFVVAVSLLAAAAAAGQSADRREIGNHPAEIDALISDRHPQWTVRGVEIEGRGARELELQEVEVFEATARVVVSDGETEQATVRPPTRYLRGRIRGASNSVVALAITGDGAITGLLTDGTKNWQLHRRSTDSRLEATTAEPPPDQLARFQCGNERLIAPPEFQLGRQLADLASTVTALPEGQLYQATVAVETDHDFYQFFGNSTAALDYIGSLFNYVSAIYELELQTRLIVGDVFLWSTTSDPWVEAGGTSCRLYEFGRFWRDNRSAVSRTVAHFLSGASSLSGIAWVDVLCRQPSTSNTATGCASIGSDLVSGGFGFSSGLSGTFQDSAGILWDSLVVAHEIGHNFSSPHTHCYAGLGGNAEPVDGCYNQQPDAGCWTGSVALPGPGSLTGGTEGGRNGTIMSYCQKLPGNVSNIAATLGLNHVYGIAPERVPTRMANRVAQVATGNPSCIPIVGGELLLTVEKSGTGSGRIVSTPAGIDCGSDCSASYTAGSGITLSAMADAGSTFGGFSGSGCSGTASCLVTMNAARTVTATFNLIPDTTPDAFGFAAQTGVSVGATVTSSTISPTGYNAATSISVANGQYSIGCTANFTGSAGTISPGQSVCVRHTAAGTPSSTVTTTLTIGGVSGTFSSTTAAPVLYLLSVSKAGSGSGRVVSTPAGIDCGGDCSESYAAGSGVTLSATADAGSTFGGFSGSGCSGTGDCLVTMNAARTVTATFSLIPDTTPDAFGFMAQTGVSVGSTVTSNTISPTGYNAATSISVANGQYSIGCTASFTGSAGAISPGQSVCVRHTAAGTPSSTVTTTLTIGGISGTFSSTTIQTQLFRAYLAADGSDGNPCTLQAPCRLLPAALSAVADGGEIWMLDSANYNTATVTINKSVSILAVPGVVGSVVALNNGSAIEVWAPNLNVALRNLVIGPVAGAVPGSDGVTLNAASTLIIEGSQIANLPGRAVYVNSSGATLKLVHSTLRDNGYYAIYLAAGATALISDSRFLDNAWGAVFAYGFVAAVTTASISDSIISGGGYGVVAQTSAAGATARISVVRSAIERTTVGALNSFASGGGTTEVNVGSSLIVDNAIAWRQEGAGSIILSLGNNQMSGNGGSVGVLTPLAPQ